VGEIQIFIAFLYQIFINFFLFIKKLTFPTFLCKKGGKPIRFPLQIRQFSPKIGQNAAKSGENPRFAIHFLLIIFIILTV
jgi:hypothetical protein